MHRYRGTVIRRIDSSLAIETVKRCTLDIRHVL